MSGHYWVRRPRPVLLALLVGIIGLILIGLGQILPNRHSIEDNLTQRSDKALAEAGLSGVDVSFTGRDGTLRVPDAANKQRALEVVRALDGVRVASAISPPEEAPKSAPAVAIAVDAGKGSLTGKVPSDAARTALVSAAGTVLGAANVQDGLTVDASVGALNTGTITLTGTVGSQAIKDGLAQAVAGQVGTVANQLQVSVPVPPKEVENQLGDLPNITFESGSATLTTQGRASVARAATILAANPTVRVRIEGHTDGNGSAAANQTLSEARARTVLTTLVSMGIPAARLSSVGFGESRHKVADTTPANQAINRRVEFIVL